MILRLLPIFIFALICSVSNAQLDSLNGPVSLGGPDVNYRSPQQYEIGPIRVEGADNYDHQAIKLIAGLRQGQKIYIPGDQISKAIKNLCILLHTKFVHKEFSLHLLCAIN